MNKQELTSCVTSHGDAIINYRSPVSGKLKYNVCTLDFDNEYIKKKQNRALEDEDTVLMWCWDVDAFKLIKAENVTNVVSLAGAINGAR